MTHSIVPLIKPSTQVCKIVLCSKLTGQQEEKPIFQCNHTSTRNDTNLYSYTVIIASPWSNGKKMQEMRPSLKPRFPKIAASNIGDSLLGFALMQKSDASYQKVHGCISPNLMGSWSTTVSLLEATVLLSCKQMISPLRLLNCAQS